ncbi:MAG TPA: amino acid adenylation domain-containing protein, partial [Thermoanaerobaculia bacterium]|nr:amino acid adenylation domain-containing protein [Thermoanaerobaculia bacterium]
MTDSSGKPMQAPVPAELLERVLLSQLQTFSDLVARQIQMLSQPTVPEASPPTVESPVGKPAALAPPALPDRPIFTGPVAPLHLPLSEIQKAIHASSCLCPEAAAAYCEPLTFYLSGPLRKEVLRRALCEEVERHEALRSILTPGGDLQEVQPATELDLPVSVLPEDFGEEPRAVAQWLLAQIRLPFNPCRGLRLRASLLRLDQERHVLALVFHHLFVDGASAMTIAREMLEIYEADCAGRERRLPPPAPLLSAIQGSVASDARMADLEAATAYWRKQLVPPPPALDLPLDRARPQERVFRGGRRRAACSPDLLCALDRTGVRQGVTRFVLLSAAYAVLLHRWTGADDLVIGIPVTRRPAGSSPLVAPCVDVLPIRSRIARALTFAGHLTAVRGAVFDAFDHDLPFSRLMESVAPPRDPSRAPLVESICNIDSGMPLRQVADLVVTPGPAVTAFVKFDLGLHALVLGNDLLFELEHIDLFETVTIDRLLGHLQVLLAAAAADASLPILDLPLLTAAEQHQIRIEWNDTERDIPEGLTVLRLIEEQALRTPEAISVHTAERQLTYSGLDAAAESLAQRLRRRGAGPDQRVGLFLGHSLELIVAALAVLKAGSAYAPLDPSLPAKRVEFIAQNARLSLILTVKRLAAQAPCSDRLLCVDGAEETEGCGVPLDYPKPSTDQLAYIIHTSGSTGLPNGVEVTHDSLCRLVLWHRKTYRVGPHDHVSLLAAVGFDASVWEIWPHLACGATLHVPPAGARFDLGHLWCWLEEAGITICFLATPLAEEMLASGRPCPRSLRLLLTGGDLLRRRPVLENPWPLVNHYGPTETTVAVTAQPVPPDAAATHLPPLGRPISGARIHLLDSRGGLLPLGAVGEIHIGGSCLARGYANDAALTADRFGPDPFGQKPGARLYRTGDLARTLPDGNLFYVGRNDRQIQVRGFRIELNEVESCLAGHSMVLEAAVVAGSDASGPLRLAAFVVPRPGAVLSPAELLGFLALHLPGYMVPSRLSVLHALPRTPTGKIDRRALAQEKEDKAPSPLPVARARSEVESALSELWSDLLELGRPMGAEESFFELGGHSLLALRAVMQIREIFGIDLPAGRIFTSPTPSTLAHQIEQILRGNELSPRVTPPIEPVPRHGRLPLSFGEKRLWFLSHLKSGNAAYNVPMAVRLAGPLCPESLAAALRDVTERHEILRTGYPTNTGVPLRKIAATPRAMLSVIDLRGLPQGRGDREAFRHCACAAQRPFDLSHPPLLQATLLRLADEESIFFLNLHHILCDSWSLAVLGHELAQSYGNALAGAAPLPTPALQYADFAVWQEQQVQGKALEEQLSFWRQQLAGAPTTLALPLDRPRPPYQTFRGITRSRLLPGALSDALRQMARQHSTTPFAILLATAGVLLKRMSDVADLVLGSPAALRGPQGTDRMIGLFLNTLVLRLRLDGLSRVDELLQQAWQVALAALAHRDLPFELLVERLDLPRDPSRTPLLQAMVVHDKESGGLFELPGVGSSPFEVAHPFAKFDLTLFGIEKQNGLLLEAEINADLFDAATAERLLGSWAIVMTAMIENPGIRLEDLPTMDEAELHQLLTEWNDTALSSHGNLCVHHLVEEWAQRTPGVPAVVSTSGQALTYGELNRRAERLAERLRAGGAGPDQAVLIALERSPEWVVAWLAVLMAGAVAVPLDLGHPDERLHLVRHATAARFLVVGEGSSPERSAFTGMPVVCRLDDRREGAAGRNRPPFLDPLHLAYVMFTSGSTGTPKGVALPHRALVNLLLWQASALPLPPRTRTLQLASAGFDVSFQEIFSTLSTGGTLVLASDHDRRDPLRLLHLLDEHRIERLFLPFVVLEQLATAGTSREAAVPRALRQVITAGEQLRST